MRQLEERYLERLSQLYPTIAKASTEIINLQAILNLPKGTEHFLTDIHGEYEAFAHVLKNGSGSVRRKIDDVFGNTLSSRDKQTLATLIYYPKEKMDRIKNFSITYFTKGAGVNTLSTMLYTELKKGVNLPGRAGSQHRADREGHEALPVHAERHACPRRRH